MTKASPARAARKAEEKAAAKAPANENQQPQQLDLAKATPDQLRGIIMEMLANKQVMRDEAVLAQDTITNLRTERLMLIQQVQSMAKALGRKPMKTKPAQK